MTNQPIIYVVDDDDDARDSVTALISQMALPTESYGSAEQFLQHYQGQRPACLLTDHRMVGMTGVDLLETLRARGISLAVVIMTAFAETTLTVRAIRGGAVTLLEKPFSNAALCDAITKALAEDQLHYAGEARLRRIQERMALLTDSEQDVLKMIVSGETNKAVAFQLNVSVRTVESRRSSIFEKMGVTSVAELVQLVMSVRSDN